MSTKACLDSFACRIGLTSFNVAVQVEVDTLFLAIHDQ